MTAAGSENNNEDKNKKLYSPEQKKKLLDFWNSRKDKPPTMMELVMFLSDGAQSDPRFKPWGRMARQIMADAKIKVQTKEWVNRDFELNDEQKTFIRNNCQQNKPYEMAKTLFPAEKDKRIEPLGKEVRAINLYLGEIGFKIKKEDKMAEGEYVSPNFHACMAKINVYLAANLSTHNMTAYQRKCIETTVQFLKSPRFQAEINNYITVQKRKAFEAEFIRSVYEKPDMTVDEVNLVINLCNDYILASDIKKQLEKLNGVLDTITEDPEGRISMSLSDAIGKVTSSYNECVKRHQQLYSLLNTSRSKRILEKNSATANIVNIFEFFREEEGRRKFLEQAAMLKDGRKNEVDKIESLDDILMMALGISKEEAIT